MEGRTILCYRARIGVLSIRVGAVRRRRSMYLGIDTYKRCPYVTIVEVDDNLQGENCFPNERLSELAEGYASGEAAIKAPATTVQSTRCSTRPWPRSYVKKKPFSRCASVPCQTTNYDRRNNPGSTVTTVREDFYYTLSSMAIKACLKLSS